MRRSRVLVLGLAFLTVAGCASIPAGPAPAPRPVVSAWPMEGGDPGRSSRSSLAVPSPWEVHRVSPLIERPGYAPEEYATPIPLGPLAYVGHAGRELAAVNWRDGGIAWRFPMRGRVFGSPALADNLLFAADDQGDLVAVSLGGKEVWRFHVSYPIVTGPLVAQGRVFVGVGDQNVFCLEAATGRPLWQYGRKFPRRTSLWRAPGLAWGDGRVYAGFADGTVAALDGELGKVLWKVELAKDGLFSDVCAGPSFRDGKVYAGVLKGPVVCLDAASGAQVWQQAVEAVSGFGVGDDLLYLGSPSGAVLALRRSDGTKVWEAALDGGISTVPAVAGDRVLAGASEGSLFDLDALTGAEKARFAPGSGVSAQPAVFEQGVLLLSNGGVLYWLRETH
ncbi:MAG: PQQ-binding-like beta-propeller repeat protein [Deltaproteobacteria bacterium]|nr:PQQ-binding-like beta-propeller repeat protein [Deltaproteobacteria bacterium]